MVGHGDADVGGDGDFLPVAQGDGPGYRLDQVGGSGVDGLVGEHPRQDHQVLVADAGHRGLAPGGHRESVGDGDQDLIGRQVSGGVVDQLEAVDVDEQHGHPGGLGLLGGEKVLEPLHDGGPVQQAGQGVVLRFVLQPELGGSLLGYVGKQRARGGGVGGVRQDSGWLLVDSHRRTPLGSSNPSRT